MEPEEEKKISVWICQEEKLVSGLSRRTTCSDVVRVLLEDSKQGQRRRRRQQQQQQQGPPQQQQQQQPGEQPSLPRPPAQQQLASLQECGGGMLTGPAQSYCIVEKWRGFERILPNKTKILRLWAAWGDEQENVRFVLVRSEASLPNAGPRSAEARVVPSKESPGGGGGGGGAHGLGPAARASLALSQERQRRVVRKAFRKLAKLNKRRGPQQQPPAKEAPAAAADRMETLVHLVLSQDHTIRQQLKRLRELDRDIDRYEAKVHLDRMQRHGVNYVQDTYLVGGEPEPPEQAGPEQAAAAAALAAGGEQAAEYARKCEQVARLQEQWRRQEELLELLAGEIQQELNERWMRRRREELAAAKGSSGSLSEADCNTTELVAGGGGGGELQVEQERVKTQLSTSLYIGLRLSTDLEAVKADLEAAQRAWADKEGELQHLLGTLQALEMGRPHDDDDDAAPSPPPPEDAGGPDAAPDAPEEEEEWGSGQAAPLLACKDCEENDEDSDTGLSSMHSQDSDSVPVCESLV